MAQPGPQQNHHGIGASSAKGSVLGSSMKAQNSEDKNIDDLVLSELYYDIARNLPPDDVLTHMHQDNLLTDGQRDHYRMMKANNQPEVERSEYLLDCLRKGEPGFLGKLCSILRNIPPASYLADTIEGKRVQVERQQSTVKTPTRTDRTKKARGESSHWLAEYKKLEQKTRMQLQAKDKEIKRLRNFIRQLENEDYESRRQLLMDMRCQVDLVTKWIDHKSETLPRSPYIALIKMALSRDGKLDDFFSGTSESSSNQSTLDRPPKQHQRLKKPVECQSPQNMNESAVNDDTKNESQIETSHDCSNISLQHFTVNVSNPPTAADSDTSEVTRPQQVTEFTARVSPAPTSYLGITGEYDSTQLQPVQQDHRPREESPSINASSLYNSTDTLPWTPPTQVTGQTCNTSRAAASQDAVAFSTTDGSCTPSTVKSNTGTPNTTSPTLSTQNYSAKTPQSTRIFRYGRELSPQSQKTEEPSTDFRAVFRKIRGRDPPAK